MAESVPVRCPACRREHSFSPLTLPCACGAPLTLPVDAEGIPERLRYLTWEDSWIAVRCPSCARETSCPAPELGCPCGTLLRIPVVPRSERDPGHPVSGGALVETNPDTVTAGCAAGPAAASRAQAPSPAAVRPVFRPVTIRTSLDAVTAAAQYLKWLGFREAGLAGDRLTAGVDLRGADVAVRVDPTTRPTTLREVECLWLEAMASSVRGVVFSLAGYTRDARSRADDLRVPLFVMDLTGTPQPVNDAADELIRTGA